MNEATEYAVTLNADDETLTAEESARIVAFVFLSPWAIFKLWIHALIYSWGGKP